MKKIVVMAWLFVIFLNFTSAAFGGNFSLSSFLDNIDSSTMVLGILFIVFLALLQFSLSKFFKNKEGQVNKPVVTVLSLALSLGAIYGINKMNIDVEDFFYSMGISQDLMSTVLPFVIIAAIIFLFWKLKSITILLLGLLFIFLGAFDIAEQDPSYTIGGILIIIWLLWKLISWFKNRSKKKDPYAPTPQKNYGNPNSNNLKDYQKQAKEAENQKRWAEKQRERADEEAKKHQQIAQEEAKKRQIEEERRKEEARRRAQAEQAQQEEMKKRKEAEELAKKRRRSLNDLKQKYLAYLFYYNRRGLTKHQRESAIKAMQIIIQYAERVGISKEQFLSKDIGNSNAKAPEELRPPFDG